MSSFALQVPLDIDPGSGFTLNGAVTELGYASGPGETRRARATQFFLENTSLTGTFQIVVPTVTLTATFGFLGVTASGSGTLPLVTDNDILFNAVISLALKNPTSASVNPNRITLTQLADALTKGLFLYDAAAAGVDLNGKPTTGFISGRLGGGFGISVQFTPAGALSGLSGVINAFLEISASSPDWLLAPPTTSDPLGFGAAGRALSGAAYDARHGRAVERRLDGRRQVRDLAGQHRGRRLRPRVRHGWLHDARAAPVRAPERDERSARAVAVRRRQRGVDHRRDRRQRQRRADRVDRRQRPRKSPRNQLHRAGRLEHPRPLQGHLVHRRDRRACRR